MAPRLDLQALLESTLGSTNVYFQPPASIQMQYPCIVYQRSGAAVKFSDNALYERTKQYQVTVIDADPDSEIPDKIATLPMCSLTRCFVADNLNHDVFKIYF